MINQIKQVKSEFDKVVWPDRKSTLKSARFTMILLFSTAVFIWITDVGVQALLRQ